MRSNPLSIIFALLLLSTQNLWATDPPVDEKAILSPPLQAVQTVNLALNFDITSIVFNFYFSSDFQNGVGANNSIYTNGTVDSNVRWEVACTANSDLQHTQGNYSIPIDQIGVKIVLTGNFGNNKIKNNAKNHPKALSLSEIVLLEPRNKNKNNAGTSADNAFTIYWQMGTTNGNMNNLSIDNGNYQYGQYTTHATFVLREAI
jgi:hypothetical protein